MNENVLINIIILCTLIASFATYGALMNVEQFRRNVVENIRSACSMQSTGDRSLVDEDASAQNYDFKQKIGFGGQESTMTIQGTGAFDSPLELDKCGIGSKSPSVFLKVQSIVCQTWINLTSYLRSLECSNKDKLTFGLDKGSLFKTTSKASSRKLM